ncbi:MAG: hypothetical protein EXS18_05555 [Verrucomicrobiae bacterium]|nr:hypothetical protein [Verrucomicrobiae bacterium]
MYAAKNPGESAPVNQSETNLSLTNATYAYGGMGIAGDAAVTVTSHTVPTSGSGNISALGTGGKAVVAGIRPIRIELPKTGQRFVFTKVLNVRDDALNLSAVAMQAKTFAAVRGTLQATAFTIGLAFVWLQLRRKQANSFFVALGVALIVGSVSHLLISMRWLHVFFILAAPAILIWLLVWLVRRYWKKHHVTTNGAVATNGHPGTGDAGVPPAIAAIAICFLVAGTGNAAETVAGRASPRGEAPPPSSIEDRAPAAVSVLSATYTGIVRERVAEFDASIDVSAAKADQVLQLFGEEVAVSDFTSTYRDATLIRDGKSVSVKLPRKGNTTLRVKFLVKLGGDVTKRQVAFAIPPALSSRVAVTIDEPEASVEFPTAVSFKSTSEKQQTRLDAIIGSGERIEVRWTPRVKRAAEMAATVFVQNSSLVRIGGGVINVRSALDYQVTQGELRQLRVALPAGYRLLKLDGEGIRTWGLKDESGGQILSVELLKGITASNYPLTVVTEKLLDAMPAQAALQLPRTLDVKRESGLVAVSGSEEVNLAIETANELQRVDTDEFARSTATKPENVVSAYRFQKAEFQLAVRVEAVQPQIEAIARNRFVIDTERTSLEAQIDYTIKRAGVFTLRLALPTGYSITGVSGEKIAQWIEKKEGDARTLEVTLKERALGAYNLRVFLSQWQRELPKSVQVVGVAPLDTQKLTGFVGVATEVGVQAKTDSFYGLTEIPASTFGGGGALLAFKFISTEKTLPKWKLAVATESVEPWVRAEVVNWLSLNESLLTGRAVIRFDIANAPVKEFRVRVPAAFKNVEVSGANIRQRDHTNEEWRVQLQSKVFGSYVLTVTWDQPWTAKDGALALAGVEALGVERETGALAIEARPPLQVVAENASADLIRTDARELPEWAGRASDATVFAYRYLRPGYKLAVAPKRFEEAEVLQALVDNVHLTTVVAEDGQMMTQMSLAIRNNARQYLEVTLPKDAKVWSAFVAGRAVKPSMRGGKVLLPLERSGADDKPVSVELTYVERKGSFQRGTDNVGLESPALDVPLKNARWELYLPVDYRYGRFGGTMAHEVEAAPLVSMFSLGDYERTEGEKVAAMKKDVLDVLSMTKSKLASGKVKDANESYNQLRSRGGSYGKEEADQAKVLEKEIRRAQAGNVIEAQRQVNANNAWSHKNDADSPAQPQGTSQLDEKAAEQQWEKLQQSQELSTARVQPLRVNLPTHGVRHSFNQVLQTEIGKPMTVQFAAANTRSVGWPMTVGMIMAGFAVLWMSSHFLLRKQTG